VKSNAFRLPHRNRAICEDLASSFRKAESDTPSKRTAFAKGIDFSSSAIEARSSVGRVIYGDGETTARHRRVIKKAAAITSLVAGQNPEWLRMIRPVPYLAAMARETIASQIVWNCLTAKEDRFSKEREVRGIIMGVRQNFDAHRKTLGTRAYVETPMMLKLPGSIAEILVGPLAPPEAEATLAALLKAEGYTYDIPILRSEAVL
jgi:hypothetical protein